jgi:site-specific DNA recombinase
VKEIRCGIYTRKSHEEGLEQEYNSLDAQRDACESYIKSQAHEGWTLVKKHYDDGGFSGGNLKRPALQEVLQDIRDDKVDVIVVYKIDRLTRSLMDFSNIIEVLDSSEASFVSVTQHFNTTSSMGRLTLNVLLSFAQFEREITGERIRDKIASSKKKGMWMGGHPPLGYDVIDKKLLLNENEANDVRTIFGRYVALESVTDLVDDLEKRNITTKRWTSENGKKHGGEFYKRGALYKLLQNRLYRGEIDYKGNIYPGQQKTIVLKPLWDAVQEKMESNRRKKEAAKSKKAPYLLEGLIHDSLGNIMSPTYSVKKGNRRYPYYVSAPLNGKRKTRAGDVPRVPALAIDELIRHRIATILDLEDYSNVDRELTKRILKKVLIYKDTVEIEVDHTLPNADCNRLHGNGDTITRQGQHTHVRISATLRLHSRKLSLINPAGKPLTAIQQPDGVLIKNLVLAHKWRESLESGEYTTLQQIADVEKCTERFIRKIIPMAYLAPDIVESILEGRQPASFDLKKFQKNRLPLSWQEQRQLLGYTA